MRIWDIHPGYLNRQSLLGEHRELHGIVSIIVNGKKGYSRHPETVRWLKHEWALRMRHEQLTCEMDLRGYTDRSPVTICSNKGVWPSIYIDPPHRQFILLKEKYTGKEEGRIPLPKNEHELWAQHKYSVLARDEKLYKNIGRDVSKNAIEFEKLSKLLIEILRQRPAQGGIRNAIEHMWGYVSSEALKDGLHVSDFSLQELLSEIQKRVTANNVVYLLGSTALSELAVWLNEEPI